MIDCRAGKVKASAVPFSASRQMSIQISAVPVMTRAAAAAWVTPSRVAPSRITTVRDTRSATTPPSSRKRIVGIVLAASTKPRSAAEFEIDSTAKARATPDIVVPTRFTVLAM